jgi:hypothetical protein
MTYEQWRELGQSLGYVGPSVCYTHDGLPTTQAEDAEFDEGLDPCIHILRLYSDPSTKLQVEENHSPSQWRQANPSLI